MTTTLRFLLCTLPLLVAAEDEVPVWEIALAAGLGTLSLCLCAFSIFLFTRNRREPRALTSVEISERRTVSAPGAGSSPMDTLAARHRAKAFGATRVLPRSK